MMLKEGDIISLEKGDHVYTDLPESLVFVNRPGIWKQMTHAETTIGKYGIPSGEYIVYKTVRDGGGTAMGTDVYPDGHHVFCFNKDHRHIKVDFYQSGCFTCMLPDKEAIGKAKLTWTVD
jgi:hypothetical protein